MQFSPDDVIIIDTYSPSYVYLCMCLCFGQVLHQKIMFFALYVLHINVY